MPIYVYESDEGVQVERVFSISERPEKLNEDGKEYHRVPAVPADVHSSFGTWNGSRPDYKAIQKDNMVIREPGMDRDAREAGKAREAKKEALFEKHAGDAVKDVLGDVAL